ncbi:minor tail protein [Lactobacillus equicursoris DSM 19284 = JCM 14600 = CIP 110162]|uniref:Minor tail protein n=1 Tax=Lactobacillus equicursoris DSM 19284 = JCM 14600 = CIP 110162 TaxID=1293597 RepID=A0A0R1M6C5_9LACO|nr:hypothetical protein [Lactobacillus equicursoris]KRL00661.1 minor tail protein [Lactobacillus equicursoris DSM 19284 = JCM 14600 = CIP 110162]
MELEQLEVLFKANYSDVIQKTQELANLFQNDFGQISSNVQNSLNQMANASNQNAQKVKQDSNDIVNAKRNEASQVNDAVNSEHGAFSRISEAFQTLKSKLANNNFDHTFDKLKQSAKKVEDTKIKAPEVDTSDLNKATRDVLKQVDTINQKMEQARREQAKLQKLMSMRTDVIKTDPESLPKLDAQIDQQRVKMTRYLNQAKSLAQNMREEFNKIPASLEQIAGAMDRNEAAINNQKQLMASLKEKMEYTYDPNQIAKFQQAYDRQNDALERLIVKQDKLGEQYAYTEDKAEAYKKVIDNLDLSLNENGEAADKAGRKNAGLGSRFASLRNMLSGLRSHFSLFGNSAEQAGNRARNGFNRGYRSGLNLVSIGRMLAMQILVYQLLNKAIMALGSAFFSALKANTQFSASLNQIQVNLLTAFYPIYKTVLPALNALMSALSQATAWIANFVAALTEANQAGAKGLYNQIQAMKDTSSASKSATSAVKKQQEEQAKAVRESNAKIQAANKAGRLAVQQENKKIEKANNRAKESYEKQKKAAEDLKNSLMGFDEINVLDKDNSIDDGGYDKQAKKTFTPQPTQTVPSVGSDTGDTGAGSGGTGTNLLDFSKPINEDGGAFKAAKDLKKLLGELFKPMQDAWDKEGAKTIKAAKYAWEQLKKAVEAVGRSFKSVWTNGTGETTVRNLLKLLQTMLNIVGDIARAFRKAWTDNGAGTKLIQSYFNALNKVLKLCNDIGNSFRRAFNSGVGVSIFSHLISIATNLNKTVGNLAGQFDKAWKSGDTGTKIFKDVLNIINDDLSALGKMSSATAKWAKSIDFGPLLKSIDVLLKAVRSINKDIWSGIEWGYKNVLLPLSKWTITQLAPNFIKALAAALKLVHTVIDAAKPAFKWAWESFLKPIAKWTGKAVIEGLKLLTNALNGLSSWASKHQKLITSVAKVLITWFTFKVSVSAIESATSKFGSLLGIAKELWTKKTVFKDLIDGIGITKIKEIGTNLKTIYSYSKDLVSISWGKITTAGGYLKTIAGIGWDKVKVGGGYLKTIAGLGWEKIKAAGGYLKTIAGLAWDGLKAGVGKLAELAKLGWSNVKLLAGYMGDLIKLGWSKLIGFVQLLGTGLKALWVVMAANPIGAVIAAIAALVAIFATLYATNKPFRAWCNGIWGNITKYFGGLGKWFGKKWADVAKGWGDFKKSFSKSWSKHWSSIKDGVVGKNGVWTHLKTQAGKTWTEFTSSLSKWWGKFSPDWKKYWNNVKTHVTGKNGVWEHLKTQSGKTWNHFTTSLAKWWPGFSSSWSKKWNSVKNTLSKAFSSLVKSAGSLGGKIAKAISGGWNAVTSTVGKLANKIIKPIQTVIQKVGQGINWALGKVGQSGFNWSFDWSYHYANGTGGHPGGLALVNDQEGDTYREAFQLPNGQTGLFPAVRNLLMDLPAGTKVMPAAQTKSLLGDTPHYAGGIGDFDFNFDFSGLNSIASSIGDFAGGVMDTFEDILKDITHPSKLVEYIISKFVGSNSETASISVKLFDGLKSIMDKKLFGWASDFLKRFGKKEKKKSSSSSSSSSGNWDAFSKSMASLSKIFSKGFGFENGGLINKEGYYLVGEGNKPEMVIPLTDKIRALELIQKSMSFMGENFRNGVQMPRGLENQISFAGTVNSGTKANNDFTSSIVNAIVQGLQMANMGSQPAGNNQPINVTIQVDSTKLGEAAIKGINQVNQANGKNMLRI